MSTESIDFVAPLPAGIYRIRTDHRNAPLYLEWQADKNVQAASLEAESDAQLWHITRVGEPRNYTITSIAGDVQLSVLKYTDGDGEEKSRVFSGGKQEWSLESRAKQFAILLPEQDKCIHLADNNSLVIRDFVNGSNQRFALEAVVPDVAPGVYFLRNRSTKWVLCVAAGTQRTGRKEPVYAYSSVTNDECKTWIIEPKRAGYTLQNTYCGSDLSPRWLANYNGPVVRFMETACRITRVPGTDFYYIALGMGKGALVLAHLIPVDYTARATGFVASVEFVQGDTRQQWELIPMKK